MEFMLHKLPAEAAHPEQGRGHIVIEAPDPMPVKQDALIGGTKPASIGQWYTVERINDCKPVFNRVLAGSVEIMVPTMTLTLADDWYLRTGAMFQITADILANLPDGFTSKDVQKFWVWLYRDRDPRAPVHLAIALRFPRQ